MIYSLRRVERLTQQFAGSIEMKQTIMALASLVLAACVSPPAAAPETPVDGGVYMVVLGKVFDRPAFMEGYAAKLPPLYEKYGGTYVAVSRELEILEGAPGFESVVIARWPSEKAAQAFWNSPEYKELIRARTDNRWGEFTVVLVPALALPSIASPSLASEAGMSAPE
jgi:uncharacterized protein (DUF1330 family)